MFFLATLKAKLIFGGVILGLITGTGGCILLKVYNSGKKAGKEQVAKAIEKKAKKAEAKARVLRENYNIKNAKREYEPDPEKRAKGLMEDVSK